LIRGCLAAVALEHQLNDREMIARGKFAETFQVAGLFGEDVLGRNRLERFRGKAQVHLVAGLAGEINEEAGKDCVDCCNPSKTPALVNAVTGLREHGEGLDMFVADFPARGQFFKFFFHKINFLAVTESNQIIRR
jgi:hypothetical protein